MELRVYINDIFEDSPIREDDIVLFCELIEYLFKKNCKIYYMGRSAIGDKIYTNISERNGTLKKRFIDIFNNKKVKLLKICDQSDNLNCHEDDTSAYYFDSLHTISVKKKSSIGEFISKKIVDNDNIYCFIVNFANSIFCGSSLTKNIYDNYSLQISIAFITCVNQISQVCSWIYGLECEITPNDNQTFLRDKTKFSPTCAKFQNRIVYQCIDGYYWYVDNKHKGAGAHIEVFGKNLKHIGTSLIDVENVNSFYQKPNRDIESLREKLNLKSI